MILSFSIIGCSDLEENAFTIQSKQDEKIAQLNESILLEQNAKNELLTEISSLQDRVKTLTGNGSDKALIASQKKTIGNLRSDLSSTKSQLSRVSSAERDLVDRFNRLVADYNNINSNYISLEKRNKSLSDDLDNLKIRIVNLTTSESGKDAYKYSKIQPKGLGKSLGSLSISSNQARRIPGYNLSISVKDNGDAARVKSSQMSEFVNLDLGDFLVLRDGDGKRVVIQHTGEQYSTQYFAYYAF
jgi:seryl-tRNA synthetase